MKKTRELAIIIIFLAMVSSLSLGASSPEALITNASLAPRPSSSLLKLDIFPQSAAQNKSASFTKINLNPKNIALAGHKYLNQEIRMGKVSDSLYSVSVVSLLALNVADYFSTKEALKYPGLQESNPIMKPFVKNPYVFAAAKIGMTAISYLNMKILYKKNKPLAWVLSIASNLAMSYVVSNNFRLINQVKGK